MVVVYTCPACEMNSTYEQLQDFTVYDIEMEHGVTCPRCENWSDWSDWEEVEE